MVSLESILNLDGSSTIRSVNIRWITEAGAWKLIKLDARGNKSVAFYSDAAGLFAEGKDHSMGQLSRRAEGEGPHLNHPSAEGYLHSKEFNREEQICGYRAFVLRRGDVDNYTESWFIPEVGAIPVKLLSHNARTPDIVDEALKIEFVPVSEADVKKPDGAATEMLIDKKAQ